MNRDIAFFGSINQIFWNNQECHLNSNFNEKFDNKRNLQCKMVMNQVNDLIQDNKNVLMDNNQENVHNLILEQQKRFFENGAINFQEGLLIKFKFK